MGLQSGFRLHCLNLSDTGEAKAEKSPAKRALMSQTLNPLAVLRAEVAASILLLHLLFSCLMGRRVTEVDLGTSLSNRFPISWCLPCSDYPADRHSAGQWKGPCGLEWRLEHIRDLN